MFELDGFDQLIHVDEVGTVIRLCPISLGILRVQELLDLLKFIQRNEGLEGLMDFADAHSLSDVWPQARLLQGREDLRQAARLAHTLGRVLDEEGVQTSVALSAWFCWYLI